MGYFLLVATYMLHLHESMPDMYTYIICDVNLKCFVVYIQEVYILLKINKVYVCLLHHDVVNSNMHLPQ